MIEIGETRHDLTAIKKVGSGRAGRLLVRCSCGVEKMIRLDNFGHTKTCGHKKGGRFTHGMSGTPIHDVWKAMMNRCYSVNASAYPQYGGAGVKVCDAWQTFEGFYEDMADSFFDGATLDRIDNDLGYGQDNCRWATPTEQNRNKSNNIRGMLYGREVCLQEAIELVGIVEYRTAWDRIKAGWTFYKAVTTPPKKMGPRWKDGVRQ